MRKLSEIRAFEDEFELFELDATRVIGKAVRSDGKQQRVAIALALANRSKILLADEPTDAVDAENAAYILDVFRRLNEETELTIVMVTHDPNPARRVNRVVSIRDGKTSAERIAKGNYAARLSAPQKQAKE